MTTENKLTKNKVALTFKALIKKPLKKAFLADWLSADETILLSALSVNDLSSDSW